MKQLALACVLVGLVLTTPGQALDLRQQIQRGQDFFEKGTSFLVVWLQNINGSLDRVVATENKARLRKHLHEMNESIHEVETAKLAFLERLALGDYQANNDISPLIWKILTLRLKVREVAILLREEYQQGGFECEQLLSEATYEKKFWIIDLARHPELAKADPLVLEKGKRAVQSLREASLELAKLTRRLDEP